MSSPAPKDPRKNVGAKYVDTTPNALPCLQKDIATDSSKRAADITSKAELDSDDDIKVLFDSSAASCTTSARSENAQGYEQYFDVTGQATPQPSTEDNDSARFSISPNPDTLAPKNNRARGESLQDKFGEEACRMLFDEIGNYPEVYEIPMQQNTKLDDLPEKAQIAFRQVVNYMATIFEGLTEDLAFISWRTLRRIYNTKNCAKRYAGRLGYLNNFFKKHNVRLVHPPRPWPQTSEHQSIEQERPEPVQKKRKQPPLDRIEYARKKQRADTAEGFEAKYGAEALSGLFDEIGKDKVFYAHCARKHDTPDTLNDRYRPHWDKIFQRYQKTFPNVDKHEALLAWRSVRRNYFNSAGIGRVWADRIPFLNELKRTSTSFEIDEEDHIGYNTIKDAERHNTSLDDIVRENIEEFQCQEEGPSTSTFSESDLEERNATNRVMDMINAAAMQNCLFLEQSPNGDQPLQQAETPGPPQCDDHLSQMSYYHHPLQNDPIKNILRELWNKIGRQRDHDRYQNQFRRDITKFLVEFFNNIER
uniref:MADF domain-containing protein n=1 Tax=Steinernema glaseri TaxID=37863 RepID=A0A1I7XZ38_9BILA